MNGDINIKINKKIGLIGLALISFLALGNFVSVVDAQSNGGVTVIQPEESAPVGTIALWALPTPPAGWIEMNGQSTASYPDLASLIGSNVPDLRGQFVRAWDNNAGIDSGRGLLTAQGDATRNITGSVSISGGSSYGAVWSGNGPFRVSGSASGHLQGANTSYNAYRAFNFDLSRSVPTANEIRPKNISLMYIIRAE